MARYYREEDLIECARTTWCDMYDLDDFLAEVPTADVAPKSDVARQVLKDVKETGRCSDPNVVWVCLSFDELAEIEKKYTEEDDT